MSSLFENFLDFYISKNYKSISGGKIRSMMYNVKDIEYSIVLMIKYPVYYMY